MILRRKDKAHPGIDGEEEVISGVQFSKYFDSYVKLSKERAIFITEDFSKEMSSAATAFLLHYDHQDPEEDITIYINSDGGDVSALSNIIDVLEMIESPVSTVCLGKAYSAGAFLLAAGTKGKRCAMKHSEMMLHSMQILYPIPMQESSHDAKSYLSFLNNVNDGMMKQLANHTGHLVEKVKQDCEKDFYLSAKDALQYGLIDCII